MEGLGIIDHAVGVFIKEYRTQLGLSQAALGKILGVSQQQASKYERGLVHVDFRKLEILAPALGVHVATFFSRIAELTSQNNFSDTGQQPYSSEAVTAGWQELKRDYDMLKTEEARKASIAAVKAIRKLERQLS